MIPSIPINLIAVSSVMKITLKSPYMAIPTSVNNGVAWLGLRRPRTSKGIYRVQFVGIVTRNDTNHKVITFRIPDMRTVNDPDHPGMLSSMLELTYSNIKTASVFQPTVSMPPDVLVTTVQQYLRLGQASRQRPTYVPSAPVLIT